MILVTPELSVPIPEDPQKALELHVKADALFKSAQFLSQFGVPLEPTAKDEVAARNAFHNATQSQPAVLSNNDITTSAQATHLKAILSEYDQVVVKSAVQIRTYVTNKLIEETVNPDPKIRMRALELLGKVGDVGLFVERSEVTVKHKTTVELESSIKDRVAKLLELRSRAEAVQDVQPKEPNPKAAVQNLTVDEPSDD